MSGFLYFSFIGFTICSEKSWACARAEFSQDVEVASCSPCIFISCLKASLFNKLLTFLDNCLESPKSNKTSFLFPLFKTSMACGIGVETMGQPQLTAYENVPLTAWFGSFEVNT